MRYVLITWLPFSQTEKGLYKIDIDGWYWDLKAHLEQFHDLHVFAPMKTDLLPDSSDITNTFSPDEIKFHPLPYFENQKQFILKLPKIVSIIAREIHRDDIIHNTATAVPPLGLITNFICLMKGYKKRLLIFDADFISDLELYNRTADNFLSKAFYLLLKQVYSPLFKFSIKNTPLVLVGGENLLDRYKYEGKVIRYKTSWVKKKDIISKSQLERKIEYSLKDGFNLCFAATLIPKKNPVCAIEAVKILKERGIPCKLNILPIPFKGDTLDEELKELIKKYNLADIVKIWGIVPYGEPFYNALREHDAILVPNLSGEEPRIIYDAMANGTVVIGSNLKGFSIISTNQNGILCDPTDPKCFADAVEKLYKNKDLLKKIVLNGLNTMEINTIENMHESRKKYIIETLI
ncbi:glycosyltransferase family 4 protein [Methanobacterium oryzae]|uniref:glycosyltransferase family 4 protein n=1 Tax=Methanobacterium oryzae TaxID=69540 RepID=UPI003D20BD35